MRRPLRSTWLFRSGSNMICGEDREIVDDVEIVFLLAAECQIGGRRPAQLVFRRQIGFGNGLHLAKKNFQPFLLKGCEYLFLAPVVEIDGSDAQLGGPGNLVDAGGLEPLFEKELSGGIKNLFLARFFFPLSSFF